MAVTRHQNTAEIRISLDAHGFEPDEDAPSAVEGELSHSSTNGYLLEFVADGGQRESENPLAGLDRLTVNTEEWV